MSSRSWQVWQRRSGNVRRRRARLCLGTASHRGHTRASPAQDVGTFRPRRVLPLPRRTPAPASSSRRVGVDASKASAPGLSTAARAGAPWMPCRAEVELVRHRRRDPEERPLTRRTNARRLRALGLGVVVPALSRREVRIPYRENLAA